MTPGRGQMPHSDDQPVVGKQTLVERWNAQAAPIAAQLGVTPTIIVDDDARARTEAHGSRGLAQGNNVYLHPEALSPDTDDGRRVLMHELVHVAQARNAASPIEDVEAEATALSAPGALRAPLMGLPSGEAAADTGARAAGTSHGLVPSNYELVFQDTVPHVESAARNIRLTNPTAYVIEVSSLELAGPHASDFLVGRMVPIRVAPGDSIDIAVKFRAAELGTRSARLVLDAGVLASPIAIALFGIASSARWERAATMQIDADNNSDEKARSSTTLRLHQAGYSLDEIDQIRRDLSRERGEDWRPTQPNLTILSSAFRQLIGSLYPDYEDPAHRRRLLFDRFAQFRNILEGRIAPTQRPSVPSGLRLVRAAFDEHFFSDDELSVLWTLDRHARTKVLARDGSILTNEMLRKRMILTRLEAGHALQSPGGTLGYAIGGIFWPGDEDRKLAAAGFGAGASNLLGGAMARYGPALGRLLGVRQSPEPRWSGSPPMEPDKATHIRGKLPEPPPPSPDGRQRPPRNPRNHRDLYTMDAFGWSTERNQEYGNRAKSAVDLVNERIARGALAGGDLRQVLDALAGQRQGIAIAMRDKDAHSFGVPRHQEAGTKLRAQYARWDGKLPDTNVATLPSGKRVRLTESRVADGLMDAPYMRHTSPDKIDLIVGECRPMYARALDPKTPVKETVELVGELHWWLAQAMPYERGSAAIVDMLTKSIFLRRGIQVTPYQRGVVPDLDAFAEPNPKAFAKRYGTLFVETPQLVNEPVR
jgi:hypothetical protein